METIRKCNLADSVSLLGYQPYSKVIDESYNNHIFINPSITANDGDTEGTPVVLMDMMATGIPVVSTYHSDIPEIVTDGITGWLAHEKDVESLVNKLLACISQSDSWNGMAVAARQYIETEFNNIIQSKKLEKQYSRYF